MTSSPGPDESGRHAPRRPDSTDPDLAPLPPVSADGPLPNYGEPAAVATADDPVDDDDLDDGAREVEETGLLNPHEPAATAVAQRLGRRPRDMVISIGVLLVVVFTLFGLYRCLGGDGTATVDAGPAYEEARDAKEFPVLEPTGLSDDWKSVSADYQPHSGGATLRVGWRSPDDGALQLIESDILPATLITRELGPDAASTGASVEEGGRQWQVYNARNGETAYVYQDAERTVIVTGKAKEAEMREFIRSLK
ncbi:DUF4245 domain-containing protein [Virgisporangium aurantiacum]|uniref:DUF4245 domain-containing protein n=1 Tax=Virgisporangium aurantiacum TaxID=175570 RepID=A0A8J3YXL1_9ACTN|nr:DUF4245 domain-containing protein [Virgisporangium aurantiacum]GIJ53521.1 hypothetical protein Vau01_010370 [Virgisporangium aurantiacum]